MCFSLDINIGELPNCPSIDSLTSTDFNYSIHIREAIVWRRTGGW